MADNVEIQGLEFQIQENSATAVSGLEALRNTLDRLKGVTQGGVAGLRTTANQLKAISEAASKIDNNAANKIKTIAGALNSLKNLGNVKLSSSIATQLTNLSTALRNIQWTDGDRLEALANGLRHLSDLGRSNLTSFITQLGKLPQVIKDLDEADLDKFTRQMKELAASIKPFADEMNKVAAGFSAFPSKIQAIVSSTGKYNTAMGSATSSTRTFGTVLSGLKFTAVIYGLRRVAGWIGTAITKSNEYQENLNLFTVAMGEYAKSAQDYAEQVADIMGIDPSDWMRNQGVFNTLLTGFGNVADRAALMSKNLTQLGYDLSSFFNISIEDAMQKLQSGISGELEPLRRLGYDLSQARLEAVALSLGIDKSVTAMTQAEKAELRYYAIMTQVTTAQGDLARTLESPANQLRILQAQFTQAARAIGNIFIPALNAILPYAIAVVQAIKEIADAIASLFGFELTDVDYSGVGNLGTSASVAADNLGDAASAAKALQQYTAGIDELNVFSPSTGGGAGAGGGVGGGSGFDFELPEYDFLGDAVNQRVDQIKQKLEPFISWVKANIDDILKTVGLIAGVLLTWKLATSFVNGLAAVKETLALIKASKALSIGVGAALTIGGFSIEFDGLKDAVLEGLSGFNFAEIILGGLVGTGGLSLLGHGIANFITSAFAESSVASAITAAGGATAGGILGAALGGIIAGVPAFGVGIYDAITKGLDWLNAALISLGATAAGAGIGAIIGMVGGPIGAGVGALIGLVVGLLTDGGIAIAQNWDSIKKTASDFFTVTIPKIWNDFINWLKKVPSQIEKFFTELPGKIEKWFSDWWEPVKNFDWSGLGYDIGQWFGNAWQDAIHFITVSVPEWFKSMFDSISEALVTFFTVTIPQKFEELKLFFKNLPQTLYNNLISSWQWMVDMGTAIIDGIWEGLQTVWSAITEFVDGFVQGFKDALGIHSPSTVFMEIGQMIMEGLTQGISGAWDFVKSVINTIIGGVESMANGVVNAINGMIRALNGISFTIPDWVPALGGKRFGLSIPTISTISIPRLASGGFVDEGQLFIAREAGAEMVGNIGRKTAVANNDQIVESISSGVTVANEGVIAAIYTLIQALEEKEMSVSIGDDDIGQSYDRYNSRRGVRVNTGAFANAY